MKRVFILTAAAAAAMLVCAETPVLAPGGVETVNGADISFGRVGEARLRIYTPEWDGGIRFVPRNGDSFDLSGAKYLAIDVENLSPDRQMRLTLHASAGGKATDSGDHASANFTKKRSINTGIGLNPGEKGTMKLLLPHADIYRAPEDARGLYYIDTAHISPLELKVQWPFEQPMKYLVDCRLSNLRLEGEPDVSRKIDPEKYCPFVDKYGQFKHVDWPYKMKDDKALPKDLELELKALKSAPESWDRFGGWKDGPHLKATGHFRTARVGRRWFLVTPEGSLFFSLGIDVSRIETDIADGSKHPGWYESYDPSSPRMVFTGKTLEKKFGKKDFAQEYYDLMLKRFDSWGINTIGNWSAGDLMMLGRKPYVISVLENAKGVKMVSGNGVRFYDTADPAFPEKMKSAVRKRFAEDPALAKAATDPMCIGFFIDNELKFPGDPKLLEPYFRTCREILDELAPNKLYLGCRFIGFRQSKELWAVAAKYCDVVTVNTYSNAIYNIPDDIYEKAAAEKPLLVGEFHFGCFDRGMFKAGLCPVWSQKERARSFTRFVQGALCNPRVVGCHWFQYRDQPLLGRGDGEAYEIGFVDVCDRPYPDLCRAARKVGKHMYDYRRRGKLENEMEVPVKKLPTPLSGHPRLWNGFSPSAEEMEAMRRTAAEAMAQPVSEREMEGRRLLATARLALRRILALSAVYVADGDNAAAERAMAEMKALASFDDWNTEHFLDTAEIAFAMGMGYDALYSIMDPETRAELARAVERFAVDPALSPSRYTWWRDSSGNWNQVCHSGVVVAALAFAEWFPSKTEMLVGEAVANLPAALAVYAPNGAYPEGPSYWDYGTQYTFFLLDALRRVYGTDFGLGDTPGFKETRRFPEIVRGPSGLSFNYGDGRASPQQTLSSIYLPALVLAGASRSADGWRAPTVFRADGAVQLSVQRNGDGTAFVGVVGGPASRGHGHMDAGSFVYDAGAKRWVVDLGMEEYARVEALGIDLWNSAQDGGRWRLYRLNSRGHNTLSEKGSLHKAEASAVLQSLTESDGASSALWDMSALFGRSVTRLFELGADGSLKLTDTVAEGEPLEFAFHTPASVEKDGPILVMTLDGRQMGVTASPEVEWTVGPTPVDPAVDSPNPGITRVSAEVCGKVEFTFALR